MRHAPRTLLAVLLAGGCSGGDDDAAGGDAGPVATVTWHQDIAPLVTEHCVGCHSEGGIGPMTLDDYETAALFAPMMAAKVKAGEMPPWDAKSTDDCEPRFGWREDPTLSAADIDLLQTWADEDAPLGDPDTAAPLPEPPNLALDGITHSVKPEVGFGPSGDTDQFICYVLDPGIANPAWVTGLHVVPSDLAIAHHAVVNAVPPAGIPALDALAGPDGFYDCFGGVQVDTAYFLGVWVPGSLPFEAPEGVGIPFVAGSKLVVQLHYHPAGATHPPERSEVQLRVTETQPDHQLFFLGIGNAPNEASGLRPGPNDNGTVEFKIPPNVADHTETMVFPIAFGGEQRFPLVSVFPHMHFVGTDLQATLKRNPAVTDEPSEECLIKVPTWNFEWQRTYLYDADLSELPTVGMGDELTIKCLYDNTLENRFVERALDEQGLSQPIEVELGEQTLDEMCLAAFGVLID
jgi:hypothetical protein